MADVDGDVLTLTFNHASRSNPMNEAMGRALTAHCQQANDDDAIRAVVLTGGPERYFGAGGDFREVSQIADGKDVDVWIDWITDLYVSLLEVEKPTIAAVDGFAVGIGFQLALCCDWRIGTEHATLIMPELAKGIGCTYGGLMLERAVGRIRMTHIVYGCERITAPQALTLGLLDEVCPATALAASARATAARFAGYPAAAVRGTKRSLNRPFIAALRNLVDETKQVHRAAFRAGGAQPHFDAVLARSSHRRAGADATASPRSAPVGFETQG
jgi:enoyl-CoA hydratase/carnithine racemase